MTDQEHMPLSRLPPELMVYIFTLAASTTPTTARTLSLVSSWTRALAKPHIFTTVILKDVHDCLRLRFGYDACRVHSATGTPESFLRDFGHPDEIRSIWLPHAGADLLVSATLAQLPNVRSLALTEEALVNLLQMVPRRWAEHRDATRKLRLFILGPSAYWDLLRVLLYEVANPEASQAMLRAVTHLRYLQPNALDRLRSAWELFPHLTHFATPFAPERPNVFESYSHALEELPSRVRLLVLVFYEEARIRSSEFVQWMAETRKRDQRVVLVVVKFENAQKDWKEEMEGGESFWEEAVSKTRKWDISVQTSIELGPGSKNDSR